MVATVTVKLPPGGIKLVGIPPRPLFPQTTLAETSSSAGCVTHDAGRGAEREKERDGGLKAIEVIVSVPVFLTVTTTSLPAPRDSEPVASLAAEADAGRAAPRIAIVVMAAAVRMTRALFDMVCPLRPWTMGCQPSPPGLRGAARPGVAFPPHGRTSSEGGGTRTGAGDGRAVRDRVRQRGQLDLLRPRLVAVFALGMTPVVFLIAGVIFICTAAPTPRPPRCIRRPAGPPPLPGARSTSSGRALTAWGQMLNYIITVAISAFFVPHYLGVFWEPLQQSPGDILGRRRGGRRPRRR